MTLAKKEEKEENKRFMNEAQIKDYLFSKSREIMRERSGLIDGQVAFRMAAQQHLPGMIAAEKDRLLKEGNFKLYHLMDRLFFSKDPAIKQAAEKELDDWLLWYLLTRIILERGNVLLLLER